MQVQVEELFLQVEREAQFDEGYAQGRDQIILNMLSKSVDLDTIQDFVNCSREHILRFRDEFHAGK